MDAKVANSTSVSKVCWEDGWVELKEISGTDCLRSITNADKQLSGTV